MRNVIDIFLLKGYSSYLTWGVNFEFLPRISNFPFRITYNRTEKSVRNHLYTFPIEKNSNAVQKRDSSKVPDSFAPNKRYRFSQIGKNLEEIKERIINVYQLCEKDIFDWFSRVTTLEEALIEANYQILHDEYYHYFAPDRKYIKAFLLSATGNYIEGERLLNEYLFLYHSMDEKTRNKLYSQLKKVSEMLNDD